VSDQAQRVKRGGSRPRCVAGGYKGAPRHGGMRVRFTLTADDQLDRLLRRLQTRIVEKLEFYSSQSDPSKFAEPLIGSSEYRFRIGDYRIIFEVMNDTIWVLAIKRRDEAYR
jgi:mRNA-degrading endonuclease RelE of RelBE toxin-antitoxin system